MTPIPLALVLAAGLSSGASAQAALAAHEHGRAEVSVALEAGALLVLLDAPGADLMGFEHAPESAAEKAAFDAARQRLADPAAVLTPAPAAGCTARRSTVRVSGAAGAAETHRHDAEDHAHDHDAAAETGHSAFQAVYRFDCADPAALAEITFGYFASFPAAREIAAHVVTETGSAQAELTAATPVLTLPR